MAENGENYIDLVNTMLYVQAKIMKQNRSVLDDDARVGPTNLCTVCFGRWIYP